MSRALNPVGFEWRHPVSRREPLQAKFSPVWHPICAMRAVRALVWLAVSAHCLPQLDPPVGLSVHEAGESSSPGGVAVMIEPRHIPERALVLSNAMEVLSSTRPEDFWSIVLLHGGGDVTDVTGNSALRAVRAQLLP